VLLVSEPRPPAPVLFPAKAAIEEVEAARELAKYLGQISGQPFSASAATGPVPARAVLVGPIGMAPPKDLGPDGFVIRAQGERLVLCGGSPQGTLYAVFSLLEDQLGCRWWAWDAEHVPLRKSIEVRAQETRLKPVFGLHDLYNGEAQTDKNHFRDKRRSKATLRFEGGHSLCPALRPYAEKRPDFLPMDKDGKRAFNNLHMNYTAPGMFEALAEALSKKVELRQGQVENFVYFAGMGDWYGGMDLSPESRRVYDEEAWTDPDGVRKPGYIATLLRMFNRSAEILEQKHPGMTVGTFAYMSLEAPPARTVPRSNVVIWLPRLRHVGVRSLMESEELVRPGTKGVSNRSFRNNLDQWVKLAPGRLYIWEYGTNFDNFLKPYPCLRSIAENIKYYHKIGVAGIMVQGNYVSPGGDLAALKNYVWGRLLWDPALDTEALVREFCRGYYGPAAENILQYVALLEDSVRRPVPIAADEFDTTFRWMTPQVVQQARQLLDAALAKTGGSDADPYYRRVKEVEASLEAHLLWKWQEPVEYREVGESLVRADLGRPTIDRVRQMLKYSRAASPREWDRGRIYHTWIGTVHGGPMPILKSGPMTVKIAPLQGGRLRSVMHGDAVAIDDSQPIALLGNVGDKAPSETSAYYALTNRTGNHVEMESEIGIASWSNDTKQSGRYTVDLAQDGVLRWRIAVKRVAAQAKTAGMVFQSDYEVGGDPAAVTVEYETASGAWHKVEVSAERPKADVPLARRLRITRRDRNLAIDDRYQGAGTPTCTVEYDTKAKRLRTRVLLGAVEDVGEQFKDLGARELRIGRQGERAVGPAVPLE
jgi:hypothetical protein